MECIIFFLSLLRNLFCDYYNSQQKIYCKRLRVLCPEHTKEPKVTCQAQITGWLSSITQASWPFVPFVRITQKLAFFWESSLCAMIRTLALLREPISQGALYNPYCCLKTTFSVVDLFLERVSKDLLCSYRQSWKSCDNGCLPFSANPQSYGSRGKFQRLLCSGKGWLRELLKIIGSCLPPMQLLHPILCEYTVTDSQLSRGYSISLARFGLVAHWLCNHSRVG